VASFDTVDTDAGADLFGVGPEHDSTATYNKIFDLGSDSDGLYRVQSMCLFEYYNIGGPEFKFRCFCNFDRCNKAVDLKGYLNRLADQAVEAPSRK